VKLQQFMRDTLRVLSAAMEINPDQAQAMYWYKNTPIPEFQHRTGEQLVSAGKTEAVISYLPSSISPVFTSMSLPSPATSDCDGADVRATRPSNFRAVLAAST